MKKSGFSLVEILLVLGTIGIITTMGIAISQNGVEKAYRQFWYTGYKAISEATFDAGYNGKLDTLTHYAEHFASLMNTTVTTSGNNKEVTSPNGIKYTFSNVAAGYYILMEIPSPKTKNSFPNKSGLIYTTQNGLYPSPTTGTGYINLQSRKDLLPFVVDDGLPQTSGSHNNTIYSYREAYCATHSNYSIPPLNNTPHRMLSCSPTVTTVSGTIIKLVDPKKVF